MSIRRRRRSGSPRSEVFSFNLDWDGNSATATPTFAAEPYLPMDGDVIRLGFYSDAAATTQFDTADSAPLTVSDTSINIAIGGQPEGSWYARAEQRRGGVTIGISDIVPFTVAIAPTLSSPSSSAIAATTATIGVTTNEANGTLYYVVTTSSTPPSAAQVKAGQNNGGTAAAKSGNQAITSTGAKTANLTGLTASTSYYGYWMHEDSHGNQSSVSATGLFTTLSSYSQTRVTFDGSDYITYTPNASMADSTGFTVSLWLSTASGTNTNTMSIIANAGRVTLTRNNSSKLAWTVLNTSGSTIWAASGDTTLAFADGLTHIAIAFNAATGTAQYYRNGAAAAFTSTTAPTAGTIHWSRGVASGLFASSTGTSPFAGTAGDLWISRTFYDLSTNIGTFYNGGTPPDLSGFGSPDIWLGKDMTVANWNAGQNRGNATMTLTMNGAVA